MKYVVPLLVACFAFPLQGCVTKPKPFDGMMIVALKMDANSKFISANSISHPVTRKQTPTQCTAPRPRSTPCAGSS